MLVFCTLLAGCGGRKYENELHRVILDPGQSVPFTFETEKPIWIGLVLAHEVSGGLVEMEQIGKVSKGGTGHWYTSREWQPVDGKTELLLSNRSQSRVETTIFEGSEPTK